MKKLLPYLGYYKRFFKLYILVMFFMYVFSIVAMVIASKFFGTDMFLGVGPIESGMSGSILGVSGAYGAVIAYQMFNELMNIRADRKRVIQSIIITSIIFTIISTIICYIMIGVYAAVASGLSGGNMMESFIKAVASGLGNKNKKTAKTLSLCKHCSATATSMHYHRCFHHKSRPQHHRSYCEEN